MYKRVLPPCDVEEQKPDSHYDTPSVETPTRCTTSDFLDQALLAGTGIDDRGLWSEHARTEDTHSAIVLLGSLVF